MIKNFIKTVMTGKNDSDQHLMTLLGIALSTRGKTFIELGVRSGTTTKPLKLAAKLCDGKLFSVDIDKNPFKKSSTKHWEYFERNAIDFLLEWEYFKNPIPDLIYIDDWHSYEHVKAELDILDRIVSPKTVILLHDLMYGNTTPYYHADLTLKDGQWASGGPYRAVAELNPQFWEFSTIPYNNGLTLLRKKYSNKYNS